jgi:opacity protein-like surface antigen
MLDSRALALSAIAVIALSSAAVAADLLPPPPAMEPPPPAPIFSADLGGWYLRGDVGLGFNNHPGFSTSPDALGTGEASGYYSNSAVETYPNPSLSTSGLFDLGVGYQVNNWFRTDITGELRGGASFQGLEVVNDSNWPGDKTGTYNQVQYGDFYRANLTSYLLMWNAYADLGTWYGLTPYVGGGVGASYNHITGGTDNGYASFGSSTTGAFQSYATGGYLDNGSHVDLAWALMAGLDFNVTHNLKLELGYRFLDYGKFSSGASHCVTGANGAGAAFQSCGYTLASKELTSNDVRIGLRYYFDNEQPAPPPEAPLVRKY